MLRFIQPHVNNRHFTCVENVHSRPPSPLYLRFAQSWERVPSQTIRLVFHGTEEQNIGTS